MPSSSCYSRRVVASELRLVVIATYKRALKHTHTHTHTHTMETGAALTPDPLLPNVFYAQVHDWYGGMLGALGREWIGILKTVPALESNRTGPEPKFYHLLAQ